MRLQKYRNIVGVIFLCFVLLACAAGQITKYDPVTHRNLAYLKPSIEDTYAFYTTNSVPLDYVKTVDTSFRQILSYEKSKGESNKETIEQITIVHDMFRRHFKEWRDNGPWTEQNTTNKMNIILEAIDIAIESEKTKNK